MPIQDQMAIIFEAIANNIYIPVEQATTLSTDVATGTSLSVQGATTSISMGNGVATEVSQIVVDSTATEVSSTGIGLLSMDVGAVGMAIAPALGIVAGIGLYSLAPEFWTNVSNQLVNAGQTVGGKVRAFLNGETKQAGFSKETIEIFKQAFMEAGLYEGTLEPIITNKPAVRTSIDYPSQYDTPSVCASKVVKLISECTGTKTGISIDEVIANFLNALPSSGRICVTLTISAEGILMNLSGTTMPSTGYITSTYYDGVNEGATSYAYNNDVDGFNSNRTGRDFFIYSGSTGIFGIPLNGEFLRTVAVQVASGVMGALYMFSNIGQLTVPNENVQPDATLPELAPFPQTYPAWQPWSVPEGLPEIYPVEIPEINPNPSQSEAQAPQEIPDNDNALEWLLNSFPLPVPNPQPHPQPIPQPDPDPQPEPDPMPEPEPEPTDEDPINPNPDPTPSPIIPTPTLPDTVPANAMFTVYAPTLSQVNSFGGWLWDSNILEQIKRIWQDPLNGIITFMKVYATPSTGGSDTIKVGVLDSGVSSAVVSNQFVTINCGSINIAEKFYNATDYTPFVSLHLYLPFIGIVELDTDEFMNGTITVTYHVDVYTGTCLAEVKSTRSPDMPNPTIVYTFSGNASQQLPLTSAEFSGALSSLVSAVGGGLAIASGGGLGLLAGASGLAHAVSHEMVHVAHSGSLSANAGIMGSRKPYVIITRHRPYDANGYNAVWGYPSNKTVYLNNCSGLVRVKDIQLETGATRNENDEIMELLKNGVIM